jgi:hypothetical protein
MLLKKGKKKKKKGAGERLAGRQASWLTAIRSLKKKKADIHRGVETYPSSYCDGNSGGILFQIENDRAG